MKTNRLLLVLLLLSYLPLLIAQNAGINDDYSNPDPSAMLHVESSNKGFIMPRMTRTERAAIPNPTVGLIVYDTDYKTLVLFDGVEWMPLLRGSFDDLAPQSGITASGNPLGIRFAHAVAIDGNYAVVGAPSSGVGGQAYIFENINHAWQQTAILSPSDAVVGDEFGISVAIEGNVIVIGATQPTTSTGKAYVFENTGTWTETTILLASDGLTSDQLGYSVAIEGNDIVVGAPFGSSGSGAGAVYIFQRSGVTWAQSQKLISNTPNNGGGFGWDVSINANWLLIGHPSMPIGANNQQGGAEGFKWTGTNWNYDYLLTAFDGMAFDNFGSSIDLAVAGTSMLVGAPNADGNKGRVYLFGLMPSGMPDSGTPYQASNLASGDYFGSNVALLDANNFFVSAFGFNRNRGKVIHFYNYLPHGWAEKATLTNPNGIPDDYMGISLDASSTFSIIGAPSANSSTGEVFFKAINQ